MVLNRGMLSKRKRVLEDSKRKSELKSYFKETTVHGFRYLVDGRTIAERCAWSFVIIGGFIYAGYLIRSNILDWENNPVMTTIESTSTPVQSIQFPTVTVCPGDLMEADRWAFIEEILNKVRFECFKENVNCSQTEAARDEHKILIGGTFGKVKSTIDKFFTDEGKSLNESLEFLEETLKIDMTTGDEEMIDSLMTSIASIAKENFRDSRDLLKAMEVAVRSQLGMVKFASLLNETIFPMIDAKIVEVDIAANDSVDIMSVCKEDLHGICPMQLKSWYRFLIACKKVFGYTRSFSGLGTYLAYFLSLVGGSFRKQRNWPRYPGALGALERDKQLYLAGIFSSLTDKTVEQISLLDIPALIGGAKEEQEFGTTRTAYPWVMQPAFSSELSPCKPSDMERYGYSWRGFVNGENDDPCKKESPCCHYFGKLLAQDFGATMTAMRFAYPQGEVLKDTEHLAKLFKDWCMFRGKYDILQDTETDNKHMLRLIPSCRDADNKEPSQNCNMFKPMLTANGICHSYNSISAASLYQDSEYSNIFDYVYNVQANTTTKKALGDGSRFGLTMYLDGNTRARPIVDFSGNEEFSRRNRKSTFTIGIGNKFTPFNTKKNIISVEPGRHTVIKVIPSQMSASDGLRNLPIRKRKCRFLDENEDLEFLNYYTQAGCQFEHMLNYSRTSCGCTPWNYPQLGSIEEVCDMFGVECFEEKMNDLGVLDNFECLSDCEEVMFTYSESSTLLSPRQVCNNGFLHHYVFEKLQSAWYPLRYRSVEDQYVNYANNVEGSKVGFWSDDEEFQRLCEDVLEYDIALVTVKLGTPILMTSVKAEKTTFAEQLATFGGTVGLFTGMSFLSAFEIIFWIKRMILNIFGGRRATNNEEA